MRLNTRLDRLVRIEHRAMRDAIENAERALSDLESGRRLWVDKSRTPVPIGRRQSPRVTPAPVGRRSTVPLRNLWNEVRVKLITHLDTEERTVLKLGFAVAGGREDLRHNLRTPIGQMVSQHDALKRLVGRIKGEARFVPAVRPEFMAVTKAFDEHVLSQEAEVFPGLLGADQAEDLAATPMNAERNASDVARSLRAKAAHHSATHDPPPRAGVLKRWIDWLQKDI